MAGRRILVIDDEPDIREIARISLADVGGYEVVTAESGREGVTVARNGSVDAILLDVMMPDLDGPATFEQLQADSATRDIPVI